MVVVVGSFRAASDWDFTVSEVPLEAEYNRAYLPSILQLQDDKAKVSQHTRSPPPPNQAGTLTPQVHGGVLWGVVQVLVLSTRGTDEVFDLFQDLDAWCEALVVQTAAYLFPLYGSPIFQPYMDKFVGTSSNLVEALSILKVYHSPLACLPIACLPALGRGVRGPLLLG